MFTAQELILCQINIACAVKYIYLDSIATGEASGGNPCGCRLGETCAASVTGEAGGAAH